MLAIGTFPLSWHSSLAFTVFAQSDLISLDFQRIHPKHLVQPFEVVLTAHASLSSYVYNYWLYFPLAI